MKPGHDCTARRQGHSSRFQVLLTVCNDGTSIPPCMGYRIGADENPFGTGAKDEL
jgi:hypothetical protein